MKKDLPVYQIQIDELENMIVDMVSIVAHPAIAKNFISFSSENKTPKNVSNYKFSNDEKMQLLGVVMILDQPIYRYDEVTKEEFYVEFTKAEIEKIVQVFMKNGLTKKMNIEHTSKSANSYIFQSFIVDDKIQAPEMLGDVPLGSWIIGVQVEDTELWADIKAGKRNGFSVEGLFKLLETSKVIKEDYKVKIDLSDKTDYKVECEMQFKILENYVKYLSK